MGYSTPSSSHTWATRSRREYLAKLPILDHKLIYKNHPSLLLVLFLQLGHNLLESEQAPALHVSLEYHPPVHGLLTRYLLISPFLPLDLIVSPDLLACDEADQFLLDALLRGGGCVYFHLQQLYELVPAVEDGLVAHSVAQFLPVYVFRPDATELLVKVPTDDRIVVEDEVFGVVFSFLELLYLLLVVF